MSVKIEGLQETVANLGDLSRATQRNVVRRTLERAGQPTASLASRLAPEQRGVLAFSIAVSPQLTRRQKREGKVNEVEMHIGPAGGQGALFYAAFQEFGTIDMPPHPYMRPAWEATKAAVLGLIVSGLSTEVDKAAARAAAKVARLAAG